MALRQIRHELVEIIIPSGSTLTRFQFPDIPNLRNSHLWGLQVYTRSQVTTSVISGNTLPTQTQVQHNSFITLVNYGGKEFSKQVPAVIYNTLSFDDSTSTNVFNYNPNNFVGQKVNWPKSYLEFTTAPGGVTALSYLLSVYYSLPEAEEVRDSGFSFGKRG
jgi:hypothetical protein